MSPKNHWLSIKNLFSIFLVVWFGYGVWESSHYAFLAKVFPFYVSLALLIFAVLNIILELRKILKHMDGEAHEAHTASDVNVDWDMPMTLVWQRFSFYISLILILYAAIYVIGYPVSMTLFIALFYRRIAKASVKVSLIAACGGFIFLTVASKVLGMEWPQGLIVLPWPLG